MLIKALLDTRAGHNAHTLGICEALQKHTGGVTSETHIDYSPIAALPAWLRGTGISAYSKEKLFSGPVPDIVVATGRRMRPVLRACATQWPQSKRVHVFGNPAPWLHACLRPYHDKPMHGTIAFRGALHALSAQSLAAELPAFEQQFGHLPAPRIGIALGGNRGKHKALDEDVEHMNDLAELLHGGTGSLIILPSRRTPKHAAALIKERVTCPYYFYDGDGENPYRAALAGCDALCVSGDSISMISEACFTGKPVFIDTSFSTMSDKHRAFAQSLIADGYASRLHGASSLQELPDNRLDELTRILPELCSRLDIPADFAT